MACQWGNFEFFPLPDGDGFLARSSLSLVVFFLFLGVGRDGTGREGIQFHGPGLNLSGMCVCAGIGDDSGHGSGFAPAASSPFVWRLLVGFVGGGLVSTIHLASPLFLSATARQREKET